MTGKPHLTLVSVGCCSRAVPASVLTAARKLKYSWILPRLIGIGAAVACRPLPHHRAYGSVHGGSRSYASSSRITKEDRATGSMRWKARQKGLWRGPGTRGHDHFQQCWLPVACVPQAATMPPDDGAWSSTAARGRIEA